ncbi:alpha/beta-hydrolase [Tothia fuscella]|uniref:Cutinase n=1 Tax=Tothia fuscella TaxID=1048955 RepID=A0A9P4NGM8_9PEZI|nr:alpha/beta-hydrolase [Tothia fuscella]
MHLSLLLASVSAVAAFPFPFPSLLNRVSEKRQSSDAPCTDVHIFLSKGWNETYPGRQGKLAGAICYGLNSCDYEDIQFYNTPGNSYCESVSEGSVNGVAQMTAYAARCPDSTLVLSGYSQGAHVAGNVLGGGGGYFSGNCTVDNSVGLDTAVSPGNKLKAVLLFGDVLHTAGQWYNVLAGAPYNSNDPRSGDQLTNFNKFGGFIRSYCDIADPLCAAQGPGPFDIERHLNYFDLYTDDAAGWVKYTLGV